MLARSSAPSIEKELEKREVNLKLREEKLDAARSEVEEREAKLELRVKVGSCAFHAISGTDTAYTATRQWKGLNMRRS